MKQRLLKGLIFLLPAILLCLGFLPQGKATPITIVTTADLQSHVLPFSVSRTVNGKRTRGSIGGMARIATLIDQVRTACPGTLVVSSGDALMGTFFFMFKGIPELESMTLAGYNVGVPGNHEFDQGVSVYEKALEHAGFDIVCANLTSRNQALNDLIKPCIIRNVAGVNVGIFGLIVPTLDRISNVDDKVTVAQDVLRVAAFQARQLRSMGAQMVMALTHIGTELDMQLAETVEGIDLVVGGHTHDYLFKKVVGPMGRERIVVHAGAGGTKVGILRFDFNGQIRNPHWELVTVDASLEPDPKVEAFLAPYAKEYNQRLSVPIGKTLTPLDARKVSVRSGESNLGDLITDACVDWFTAKDNSIDGALINGGGIRGDRVYPAGPLSMKDILNILPFGNTLYRVTLTGQQLKQVLEISASSMVMPGDKCPEENRAHGGGFLQVSGIRMVINPHKTSFCAVYKGRSVERIISRGNRIQKLSIRKNGRWIPIHSDETYTFLVTSWIAKGGDGYFIFPKLTHNTDTTMRISDLLTVYIRQHTPIHPETDGRITVLP